LQRTSMYASFLKIRASCIWSFFLCRRPWRLITKSSQVVVRQVRVRQNRAPPTGNNEVGNVKSAREELPFLAEQGEGGDGIGSRGVILADPESPGTCTYDLCERALQRVLARIMHETPSRDCADGRATGQPSRGIAGLGLAR
jgi:hypothetical protein